MKKNPFFIFLLSCMFIGLIACNEEEEISSLENSSNQPSPSQNKPKTTKNSPVKRPSYIPKLVDNNQKKPKFTSSKKQPTSQPLNSDTSETDTNISANTPETDTNLLDTSDPNISANTSEANTNPDTFIPSRGIYWSILSNGKWTITIGQHESWEGINGTGDLTYYACDTQNNCLGLTGGQITCREALCTTVWNNGSFSYVLEEPFTEEGSALSSLIVREDGSEIFREDSFELIDATEYYSEDEEFVYSGDFYVEPINDQDYQDLSQSLFLGQTMIADQSFNLNLQGWGDSIFATIESDPEGRISFDYYLVRNDEIVYTFPLQEDITYWSGFNVDAISFQDLDYDGDEDIIIMASYVTGIGSGGANPFPVSTIYFNNGTDFSMDQEINTQLLDNQFSTIAEVEQFVTNNFR